MGPNKWFMTDQDGVEILESLVLLILNLWFELDFETHSRHIKTLTIWIQMITICQFSPINSTFSPLRKSVTKSNLQEDPNTKSAKLHLQILIRYTLHSKQRSYKNKVECLDEKLFVFPK